MGSAASSYTHAFEVISAQTPLPSLRFPCLLLLVCLAFRTRRHEEWPMPGGDQEPDDPSITARGAFYRIGVRMWRDHPAVGVGFENFSDRFPEYNRRVGIDPDEGTTAHSLSLQVLAETGLLGFTLWLVVLVTALRRLWRARRRAGAEVVGLADALLIAVAGYHASALFQGGSYLMLYWLLLGLCLATSGLRPQES